MTKTVPLRLKEEMNAIVSDQDLLLRIKTGARQARYRRGRLVD
jgi:hypothetical protein